ncbi:hypothetical protein EKK58_05655 [Candidatus Dependentiae bacterium]|nr:MAG: hypothetical protein EKK58_05655 [Candidatus Dependentiae bacterium]
MSHPPAPDPFYSLLGKAQWTSSTINRLPDTAFLYVEPGGKKDETGRTAPRSLRHLPVYDVDGHLDLAHLRNALAQIPKAGPWLTDELRTRLTSQAQSLLERALKTTHQSSVHVPEWALGVVRFLDTLEALGIKREDALPGWTKDVMVQKRVAGLFKNFKASGGRSERKVAKAIEDVLRKKAALHNASHEAPGQKTKLSTLKSVFLRGLNAQLASERPTVMTRYQWGFERVSAFLRMLAHHGAKMPSYASDIDLLPEGHPFSPLTKSKVTVQPTAKSGDELPDEQAERRFFQGIPVVIDRPVGFVQEGPNKTWTRTYKNDYGYIPSTLGGDGEELDVFVLGDASSQNVYWCVQTTNDGRFDEYKVILGASSEAEARACYCAHIPEKFLSSIYTTTVDMLRALLGLEPREAMLVAQPRPHLVATPRGITLVIVPHGNSDVGASAIQMSANECESMAKLARSVESALPAEHTPRSSSLAEGLNDLVTAENEVLIISPREPYSIDLGQLASVVKGFEHPWLLEMPDTTMARAALLPLGHGWTLTDGIGRLFISSYSPPAVDGLTPVATGDERTALQKAEDAMAMLFCKVAKAANDAEEQFVLGPVLIPGKFDLQGDRVSKEWIRKTAHEWMMNYQNVGLEHAVSPDDIDGFKADVAGLMNGKIKVVQSYLTLEDSFINGRFYPEGTWLLGAIFVDADLWAKVKSGEIRGWSIGGYAKRNPVSSQSVPEARAA